MPKTATSTREKKRKREVAMSDSMMEPPLQGGNVYSNLAALPFNAISAERLAEEQALYARFSRPVKKIADLTFEFTRDKGLLQQYYNLREEMYTRVWGLSHFNAQEDEFDRRSHIVVARRGRQVVGGARLTIHSPRNPLPLPMECEEFCLEKLLPKEYGLAHCRYGEFSRLAVLPEFAGLSYDFAAQIRRKSIANGLSYTFAISPLPQIRNFRQTANKLKLTSEVLRDIHVPPKDGYDGEMYLLMIDLRDQYAQGKVLATEQDVLMPA